MVFGRIVLLQMFWFLVVYLNDANTWPIVFLSSLILIFANYLIFSRAMSFVRYALTLLFFLFWGGMQDSLLLKLGILKPGTDIFWLLSLWVIFICYYGDIFDKLSNLPFHLLAILGASGGAFSYWSGAIISELSITPGRELDYLLFVALSWAIFFPVTIREFYHKKYSDIILDKTVIFSFDKTGFNRHSNEFKESIYEYSLVGKNALVTGGTSGIGESVATSLSKQECDVTVTGRDCVRGKNIEETSDNISFCQLDLSEWDSIEELKYDKYIDFLVLNAGGMPIEYTLNSKGVEGQVASQLIGHYKLMFFLRKRNLIDKDTRIVWVSSGGMYLKELDLENLFTCDEYDKVATYANVKRSQVTLVEELVELDEWHDFHIFSMHPGWVKTQGLDKALPSFVSILDKRLRSPFEGADTIVWLCLSQSNLIPGKFYFDRRVTSPYITKKYIPSISLRRALLDKIREYVA